MPVCSSATRSWRYSGKCEAAILQRPRWMLLDTSMTAYMADLHGSFLRMALLETCRNLLLGMVQFTTLSGTANQCHMVRWLFYFILVILWTHIDTQNFVMTTAMYTEISMRLGLWGSTSALKLSPFSLRGLNLSSKRTAKVMMQVTMMQMSTEAAAMVMEPVTMMMSCMPNMLATMKGR